MSEHVVVLWPTGRRDDLSFSENCSVDTMVLLRTIHAERRPRNVKVSNPGSSDSSRSSNRRPGLIIFQATGNEGPSDRVEH
jgi:hypothetical protein